jgi:hypothetical protein
VSVISGEPVHDVTQPSLEVMKIVPDLVMPSVGSPVPCPRRNIFALGARFMTIGDLIVLPPGPWATVWGPFAAPFAPSCDHAPGMRSRAAPRMATAIVLTLRDPSFVLICSSSSELFEGARGNEAALVRPFPRGFYAGGPTPPAGSCLLAVTIAAWT